MIYCSNIWFKPETSTDDVLSVTAKWLKTKTSKLPKGPIDLYKLKPSKTYSLTGHRIDRDRTDSKRLPYLESIKYSHKDSKVNGRLWITEVGLRRQAIDKELQVSVLLDYEDVSAGFDHPVPTRPQIIPELIRKLRPSISDKTIGHDIKILDNADTATWFWWDIERPDRNHPIIVVSPTSEGFYLIDPGKLMSQLIGIAQIVQIPPGSNTFKIEKEIGRNYIAYNGAVNIILPEYKGNIRSQKILPDEINQWVLEPDDFHIKNIFSRITYHTNLSNSRLHISLETVKDENRSRKLSRYKNEAKLSGDSNAYIQLLEEEEGKLRERLASLEKHNETIFIEKEDEIAKLKFDIESLKSNLKQANIARYDATESESLIPLRESIYQVFVLNNPALIDALRVIQYLHPENVVILDTAWDSAEKAEDFRNGSKIFSLLQKLADNYYKALIEGKGDTEAKNIFGKDIFAAKESKSVGNNKTARQQRTFIYEGKEIVMEKHLRVGIKESDAETARIHFHWDAQKKKIVIGHCGPHLKQK